MSNSNKINFQQKIILADFMTDHPDLAKNKLSNCSQARATVSRLWNNLTAKLNASGPPVKTAVMWRKVYTDQKHQVKRKLSFNKSSKKETGGGPFKEKLLSSAEEQIVVAAGLTASVEGLSTVTTFGSLRSIDEIVQDILEDSNHEYENLASTEKDDSIDFTPNTSAPRKNMTKVTKTALLQKCVEKNVEWRSELKELLISIRDMKEKKLKIKEEEHALNQKLYRLKKEENSLRLKDHKMRAEAHAARMSVIKVDLEIKVLELEMLKDN